MLLARLTDPTNEGALLSQRLLSWLARLIDANR